MNFAINAFKYHWPIFTNEQAVGIPLFKVVV